MILERLEAFGLIEYSLDYSRSITIKPPSIIKSLLNEKEYQINSAIKNFTEIIPSILNNFFQNGREAVIKVFDGDSKFKFLFNSILEETTENMEILNYNEGDNFYNIVDKNYFFKIWIEKRISKNVFSRILLNPKNSMISEEVPKDKAKFRICRILPKQHTEEGGYWIVGNKLIIWDTTTPKAILIENTLIAELFRQQFELVWSNLK